MTSDPPGTAPPARERSDSELLRDFAAGDPAAFEVIVSRHGALVLSVCRRVLDDAPEADDAFQATFLVLVRKAGSLRSPELLGNWLYGVAVRCARRAKAEVLARVRGEPMPDLPAPPAADPDWSDARPVIDEEIGLLPERLRTPLVLCELQGVGRAEAARALGIPEGTVSSRLARAKEALRGRLVRRGVALSAAGLAVVLVRAGTAAAATVPPPLLATTTRAVAGRGIVTQTAHRLAARELTAARISRGPLVTAAVGVVVLGLLGTGAIGACHYWAAHPAPPPPPTAADDLRAMQGRWEVTEARMWGRPVQGTVLKGLQSQRFEVKDDTLYHLGPWKFTLDATKSPRQIDGVATGEGQANAGTPFHGVYEVKGDELQLHFAVGEGAQRPTGFAPGEGPEAFYMRLRRAKP